MNLVAFGLILICCHAWAIEIDDNFSVRQTYASTQKTKLEGFLENSKDTLRKGDPKNGIPILDPFTTNSLLININEDLPLGKVIFNALLTNFKVTGLSSYQVNSADFKVLGLTVHADLNWPLVYGSTNYVMNGSALGYEVNGKGNMNATVTNFRIQSNMSFKLKGAHIQIKKMTTAISLGKLDLHATGLFNDDEKSEIVCKAISDMAPKLIKDNQKMITDNINYVAMDEGNKMLSSITLKEILKMLGL